MTTNATFTLTGKTGGGTLLRITFTPQADGKVEVASAFLADSHPYSRNLLTVERARHVWKQYAKEGFKRAA